MYIVIVQVFLFSFYVSFIWAKYGIQPSLSESWYILESKYRWMFGVILCWGVGVLHLLHNTTLFFLSGALLCFVGVASDYRKQKMTKIVHYIGAIGAIGLSILQLAISGIYWPLLFTGGVTILAFLKLLKNRYWWLEIIAFYSILGGIIQLKL